METGERTQQCQDGGEEGLTFLVERRRQRRRRRRSHFFVDRSNHERGVTLLILFVFFLVPATESFLMRNEPIAKRQSMDSSAGGGTRWLRVSMDLENRAMERVNVEQQVEEDRRPHEQRTAGPRAALRLNHGFRYLYRHNAEQYHNTTSIEYLQQFYSAQEIQQMNESFPPLLGLSVTRHLYPKIRFLQGTMGINIDSLPERMKQIPPQYFGARLERIIAPRHAFLMHHGLPHGTALFDESSSNRWTEFLVSCRTTKRFCALCNQWRDPLHHPDRITSTQIEAFDTLFGRGILAAARNELCQSGNPWPLEHINISSAELIELNIRHGANPLERDNRGSTLLHWAAGTGNLDAVKVLLPYFPKGILEVSERDGATPLHWATAGVNSKEFGTGGHPDVCRYLLSQCSRPQSGMGSNVTTKELVNQVSKDGNSPLMWASWSGTLETVKLMVRTRADFHIANRNGCTVAHWAASGGNLKVCQYLSDIVGVDFFIPNHGGNTPLTHAVAFGRVEVVQWLRECMTRNRDDDDDAHDEVAMALAENFCVWKEGDESRRDILRLFQDDYRDWGVATTIGTDDDSNSLDMAHELELE
jgi:ankyrin repeat protein